MSDMYDRVINVLNSESEEETKELMYGYSGLLGSSSNYYKSIATSFIKKKEEILPKHGYSVTYDLEKDVNDMIDILFIWKYIINEWKDEQKEINKEKDKLKSERKKETDPIKKQELTDKINLLNNNSQEINKYIQKINSKNVFIKDENKIFKNNELESEREELKKAINMIVKIRNSLSHRNKNLIIGEDLIIDTDIKVKIPTEYMEGFNKSQITPKEQDKQTYAEAATLAELIMKNIDKDPRKITSFFATINPDSLSILLDIFKNDIDKLYQLPINMFYLNNQDLIILTKFASNEKLDIETLKYISRNFDKKRTKDSIDTFCYLKYKNNIDNKEFFKNLAKGYYYNTKKIDMILELFEKENIDYEYLKYVYPTPGFSINKFKEILLFLKNNNIDYEVLKYLKYEAYDDSSNTIKILKYMMDNNYDYSILKHTFIDDREHDYSTTYKNNKTLKHTSFYSNDPSISIKLLEYIKDNNLPEEKQRKLLNYKIKDYNKFIKVIEYFDKENIDYDCINSLLYSIDVDSYINLYKFFKEQNLDSEEMKTISNIVCPRLKKETDIPYFCNIIKTFKQYNLSFQVLAYYNFNDLEETSKNLIETAKYLMEEVGLDSFSINKIFSTCAITISNNNLIKFIKYNNLPNDIVKKINSNAFDNLTKTQKLIDLLNEKNIDLSILKALGVSNYKHPKESASLINFIINNQIDIRILDYFYYDTYESIEKTISLLKYIKEKNIDPNILKELPSHPYSHSEDLKGIINYMLKENISLDLIKYFPKYDVSILNKHHENIKYLSVLSSDNPEKIKEYPKQFFVYDIGLIDETLSKYNDNIIKSIFGTNDYKMIASIIYANNILTNNNIELDKKEKKKVFTYIFKNVNKFTEEIYKLNRNRKDFSYKQMFLELSGWAKSFTGNQKVNGNEFVDYFIEKTRNSSAHIRYKPSAVKGFINMYDQDNDGNLNFSIDIKPEYLVEITHIVEESLNKEKQEEIGRTR